MPTYLGIDIAKDTFEVAFPHTNCRYKNTTAGIEQFLAELASIKEPYCVMEATGNYHTKLATLLHADNIAVAVVNPYQIRKYAQLRLARHKTDKADAKLIANFASDCHEHLTRWEPESPAIQRLRQLRMLRAKLKETETMYKNQRHALEQLPAPMQWQEVLATVAKLLKEHQAHLVKIEKQMQACLDETLEATYKHLTSIKGIGNETALMLITLTGNFTRFTNAKVFADFIGIAPTHKQSGTSVKGKGGISKIGDALARKVLYMGAKSAARYNPACKAFYARLRASGKCYRHAIVAVANKLLKQAFAVVRLKQPFQDLTHTVKPSFQPNLIPSMKTFSS
jgi:transposase